MLEKCRAFLRYLWNECRDAGTIALFFAVVIAFYAPAWGGFLLYVLTGNELWLAGATSYALFWAGPFTPFFPVCLTVALALRRLWHRRKKKKEKGDSSAKD